MAIQVSRAQLDSVFKLTLLINSIVGFVSFVVFILSSWWIFLLLGTIGLPFTISMVLLYKYTRLRAPMKKYIGGFFVRMFEGFMQNRSVLIRRIYRAILWFVPRGEWKHISWGYATMTPDGELISKLDEIDQDRRLYVQLYHYIATGFGNWNTLEGKNILEIGSGGAGGLNYIAKYLNPNKCIGVDDSASLVKFSKRNFGENPTMKFYHIDKLENLSKVGELQDERIDLAISVQPSKSISDFKKFTEEVSKTLKRGGVFIFSDVRRVGDWAAIEQHFETSELTIVRKQKITENVVQAIKIDEAERWTILTRGVGSFIKRRLMNFGLVKDSIISQALTQQSSSAMAYILQKSGGFHGDVNNSYSS